MTFSSTGVKKDYLEELTSKGAKKDLFFFISWLAVGNEVTGSLVTKLGRKAYPSVLVGFKTGTFQSRVEALSHHATFSMAISFFQ